MRHAWKLGDNVFVYSFLRNKWIVGRIRISSQDENGEWLDVCYFDKENSQMRHKQVQRFEKAIQPISDVTTYTVRYIGLLHSSSILINEHKSQIR